jgi:hypothetical protein
MSLAVNLTSSTTMLGVVYSGEPYNVDVVELPRPSLLADTDAIVKIKIAGICGTDMHMYHGLRGAGARWGLGHEALGVVSEIGSAVSSLAIGDYVVIPDNVDSGHLDMEPAVVDVFGVGRGLDGLQGKQDIPTISHQMTPGSSRCELTLDSGRSTCPLGGQESDTRASHRQNN